LHQEINSILFTNLTYNRTNGLCVVNKIIYAIFETDFTENPLNNG
jgi:general stress protein CsbA